VLACDWEDTPFVYDDAVALAKVWGLGSPDEAKLKVASYYTAGQSAIVKEALASATAARPAPEAADTYAAYDGSGYNYCDAKLVGALFKRDADFGKLTIGQKVTSGNAAVIPDLLTQARQSHRCAFEDTPYSYDDAAALAKLWGLKDPAAAKLKVADAYTSGDSATIAEALASASAAQPPPKARNVYRVFINSGYTFCDAKLVGQLYNYSTEFGKLTIGTKIVNGLGDNIPTILQEARASYSCEWEDTGHSYDDAVALAKVWGLDSPAEAKAKVAQAYTAGQSGMVKDALATPIPVSTQTASPDEAFVNSGYSYCDAKLVGALFGTTPEDGKLKIGQAMVAGRARDIPPMLARARASHACQWADTRYGYDDAVALAKAWGMPSPYAAKLKAARQYTAGQRSLVEAALGR
jgi:hypothetical protein